MELRYFAAPWNIVPQDDDGGRTKSNKQCTEDLRGAQHLPSRLPCHSGDLVSLPYAMDRTDPNVEVALLPALQNAQAGFSPRGPRKRVNRVVPRVAGPVKTYVGELCTYQYVVSRVTTVLGMLAFSCIHSEWSQIPAFTPVACCLLINDENMCRGWYVCCGCEALYCCFLSQRIVSFRFWQVYVALPVPLACVTGFSLTLVPSSLLYPFPITASLCAARSVCSRTRTYAPYTRGASPSCRRTCTWRSDYVERCSVVMRGLSS